MKKKNFYVYIDDTGFNAFEKTSNVLRNEKATCAGIIIREDLKPVLENLLNNLSGRLYSKYNTKEFHFTDIYNRRGAFKNIQIDETLDIIDMFAEILEEFSIKVVTQTINVDFANEYGALINNLEATEKYINLPVENKSHALLITYFKAKKHAESLTRKANISKVISDEGLKKPETVISLPNSSTTIEFKSSSDEVLLQLADFSAWLITRCKNIFDKASKNQQFSEIDKRILEIYSRLSNNYIDFLKLEIALEGQTEFSYDNIIENLKNQK